MELTGKIRHRIKNTFFAPGHMLVLQVEQRENIEKVGGYTNQPYLAGIRYSWRDATYEDLQSLNKFTTHIVQVKHAEQAQHSSEE